MKKEKPTFKLGIVGFSSTEPIPLGRDIGPDKGTFWWKNAIIVLPKI